MFGLYIATANVVNAEEQVRTKKYDNGQKRSEGSVIVGDDGKDIKK